MKRPDEAFIDLLKRSGSSEKNEALAAQRELAKAIELPLREGVLVGNILDGIFEAIPMEPGTTTEFPLDLLAPGEEDEFVAYTNPGHGRIPERAVEGDYVMVPTYSITSSIDYLLRYAREARWDVVGRAVQVLEASFVKKMNDDGWHTILSAGTDRNILVYDADAAAGQFTKRLVSLMKTVMRRNGGGNSASINRSTLTDLYISPEGLEDIRNWGVDQIDEVTRREIYQAADGSAILTRVFGVNIHDIDELGESQEYQKFFTTDLSGSLGPSSDVELVVGLDQNANDSFVMPVKENVQVYEDDTMHRHQRAGMYGWAEMGFAVLDNRRVLLGSF
jgi:hypothetical protein|tara:strand:- start:2690 stop:3691 length:1002 start_codon:yes stop_codon:yes gene_type:complete